jgi:hypothetical protein
MRLLHRAFAGNVVVLGSNVNEDETGYVVAGGAKLFITDGASLIANGSTSDIIVRSGNGTWSYACSLSPSHTPPAPLCSDQ